MRVKKISHGRFIVKKWHLYDIKINNLQPLTLQNWNNYLMDFKRILIQLTPIIIRLGVN